MQEDRTFILYSYRRCPYAIRARIALNQANIVYKIMEISLKNKPEDFLACAPKGRVPVLRFPDGRVIDESLDIMLYALTQHDPHHWLPVATEKDRCMTLITQNDQDFKPVLDICKYAERHTPSVCEAARRDVHKILSAWDKQLVSSGFFHGDHLGLADIALLPFVRQCFGITPDVTEGLAIPALRAWLETQLNSAYFLDAMKRDQGQPC
jgi:glutathione S-transferase